MDVADVATAGFIGAVTGFEGVGPVHFVDIADGLVDEVAAAHGAVAIDRDDVFAGVAILAEAGVAAHVNGEERIDGGVSGLEVKGVVIGDAFVGVDPDVNFVGEGGAEGFDGLLVFAEADGTDAEARASGAGVVDLADEGF